jgi:glyoxylase-like metal-dependent hydrolase (beta-lactamase superfamily II)
LALSAAACGTSEKSPVEQAAAALGGVSALKGIRAIQVVSSGTTYEPFETQTPTADPISVLSYQSTLIQDVENDRICNSWQRMAVILGATLQYSELLDAKAGVGLISGREGLLPAPVTPANAARIAYVKKHLQLSSPWSLVLLAATTPTAVSTQADGTLVVTQDGIPYTLTLDPATHLVSKVVTIEDDPITGDRPVQFAFDDWRSVGAVKFPFKLTEKVGDTLIIDETRSDVSFVDPSVCVIPGNIPSSGLPPDSPAHVERAKKSSEWFVRLRDIGVPLDIDLSIAPGPTFDKPFASGVFFVNGLTHHGLLIEMQDHLILVEAPVNPELSQNVLAKIKARYPSKPIRFVINTHFHFDHAGGLRDYVAEGATIIVPENSKSYYDAMFSAKHTVLPDALESSPTTPTIVTVSPGTKKVLTDTSTSGRTVEIYAISDAHAKENMFVYLPREQMLFQSDMYNGGFGDPHFGDPTAMVDPGYPMAPSVFRTNGQILMQTLTMLGLDPQFFVGGHGYPATKDQVKRGLGL